MDDKMKNMFDDLFFKIFEEYGFLISDACIVFRKTDNLEDCKPLVEVIVVG